MRLTATELVIGFVLLDLMTMGGLAAWFLRRQRRRTRELQAAAAELGLKFSPRDDSLVERLAGLPLLTQAVRPSFRNVLAGTSDDLDVRLLDCQFTLDAGDEYRAVARTAVCLQSAGLDLPWFAWRTDDAAKLLGGPPRSAEITDLKGFESSGHRLFAREVEQVGDLFQSELLGHLEGFPDLSVEGDGDRLFVYRFRRQVKPAELRELLTEAIEVLGWLRKAASVAPV
jgi:hypothetical protein